MGAPPIEDSPYFGQRRRFLGDEERMLIRWMIAEKNIAMPDLCRLLSWSDGHLRHVLGGKGRIDLGRYDRLIDTVVSPWPLGTPFDRLKSTALHEVDRRLLGPLLRTTGVAPPSPPRSHVGLHRLELLVGAPSGAALLRRYPLSTSCGSTLRTISIPWRGRSVRARILRHYEDHPEHEPESFGLNYAARFDVRVPSLQNRTVAVLRTWPKNRRQFRTQHDVHLTINGVAFDHDMAVPLVQELLRGVATTDTVTVHRVDVAVDVEAPYGALAAFQTATLPGIGFFRGVAAYDESGTATGLYYGNPSGHHRLVIYDKSLEIGRSRRGRRITASPAHLRDWTSCTRYEYRIFPHRAGGVGSPDSCLTSFPKVWTLWKVADMRQFRGACPAVLYLAAVREAGHLEHPPIASRVLAKVERHRKWVSEHPDAKAANPLSASERVLHARYQRRTPIDVAEREAGVFHERAAEILERTSTDSPFRIGDLVESDLSALQSQIERASRIWTAP